MTLTETLSCLRQIEAQWSTTNIPSDKLAALEAACLIETRSGPTLAVRLTPTGQRCKMIAESHHTTSTSTMRSMKKSSPPRQKRSAPVARELV
jgi:hypothetical protein